MADPIGSAADSDGLSGLFQSPPESASADALSDWLADPIGFAADPQRTKSADYSPHKLDIQQYKCYNKSSKGVCQV